MKPTGAARLAGVAGDPIAHSLSPSLMAAWIKAAGLDAVYSPFRIAPDDAEAFFRALARTQCSGLNITLPHKQTALAIADQVSPAARAIGAANLLTFRDGMIHADNTDAAGFLGALLARGVDPERGPALVLGAGGAARAIAYALHQAGVPEIRLSNRSRSNAADLARDLVPDARIHDWDDRDQALDGAALIVNATSLGLSGAGDLVMDWRRAPTDAVAADSVYKPLQTGFLRDAAKCGLGTVDGLGMLIGQARPSFEAFFGIAPPEGVDAHALLHAMLEPAL
ncbi:shikimate dehydrogenase family protein [Maricaulis salignorans]|uniref:Shikimate dehydrogenase (NADP(+)) n=1 Tax=Maricaulis salignorans TaxID=144026 RepID=A0A1G9R523_9PROT|nr:shikimate dehydrogenase [Maricaulis salignorans]SDM18406.1 shikimate dehydrogenase [Maricaulis salignorans]